MQRHTQLAMQRHTQPAMQRHTQLAMQRHTQLAMQRHTQLAMERAIKPQYNAMQGTHIYGPLFTLSLHVVYYDLAFNLFRVI